MVADALPPDLPIVVMEVAGQPGYVAKAMRFIGDWEALRLVAYRHRGGPWTVGYGHAGRGVHRGMRISEAQARGYLFRDIADCDGVIDDMVKVPITHNMRVALLSLMFNVGCDRLWDSSLIANLNRRHYGKAADHFLDFVYARGKRSRGLARRRTAERALFLSPS